jgi:hydroxyacylglutathione hydrolase
MKVLNREGPPVLGELPKPTKLTPERLEGLLDDGAQLVDARPKAEFNQEHIPGALNIQADEGFSNWAGWILDPERPIVLVAPSQRIDELVRDLIRVGLDRVAGYLTDVASWRESGRDTTSLEQVSAEELYNRRDEYTIVDVRGQEEWNSGHIPGALHVHVGYIAKQLSELPTDRPLALHCAGGDRSNLAASILKAHGVENVSNVAGGIMAWQEAGLPVTTESEETAAASTS